MWVDNQNLCFACALKEECNTGGRTWYLIESPTSPPAGYKKELHVIKYTRTWHGKYSKDSMELCNNDIQIQFSI